MNIQELDAYNLDDAVKFNDHLNPSLWDKNEHLKPEVREQLLKIAEDFKESLGIKDLDLKDITISGSNAAYTYTPNSDIDLHLVVDQPEDPVYRELFDAKKAQYNDTHDIKIRGFDVELYVEAADKPPVSQGTYSLLQNEWTQIPRRVKSNVDDTATRNKFETVGHAIERAVKSGDRARMDRLARKIKRMRQTGLEQHGEFGPENLAFKMLRSQGVIKKLHDARVEAKNQELSLKERRRPGSVFTYGFKHEDEIPAKPELVSEVEETALTDEEILEDFIKFCVAELKIEDLPKIKLRRDPQWPVVHKTFGRYMDDKRMLEVAWGQRHIMDVLRTVAHELTHRHQHERDGEHMGPDAGETGSPWENEANARAGILMRDYARLHPDFFAHGEADSLHIDEASEMGNRIPSKLVIGGYTFVYNPNTRRVTVTQGGKPFTEYLYKGPKNYETYAEVAYRYLGQTRPEDLQARARERGSPTATQKSFEYPTSDRYGINLPQGQIEKIYRQHDTDTAQHGIVGQSDFGKFAAIAKRRRQAAQQDDEVTEGAKSSAAAAAIVAALAGGPVSAQAQNILGTIRDIGSVVRQAQNITRAGINDEVQQEIRNFIRAQGGDPGSQNLSHLYQLQRELQRQEPEAGTLPGYVQQANPANESASGYIPTKRQANDPRFKMALTKDIQPGQLGKEANKLRLKTDCQGHPQVAQANGLFEHLRLQLEAFKKTREDFSPDNPPGPESKPTMPRGTVRVDVSDMYDWYKLGQNISNLKGADKSRFGKGPPSTIVSFGDEDTEHQYIKDLENLGLTTTDIDPVDPKQPKGMRRQKTDPTYNVNEQHLAEFDPAGYGERYTLYIDDYNTKETFADLEDAIEAVEAYKRDDPKSQYADYNIRDLGGEVVWRNDAWQDVPRPGRIQFLPPGQDLKETNATVDRLQKQLDAFKRGKLTEAEELDEVSMRPSSLKQFANSPEAEGIQAGFEAELIFRDTLNDDDDSDNMEPDYDADERCTSISQIVDFFNGGEYGGLSSRQEARLTDALDEAYYEWRDEQMFDAWRDDRDELVRDAFLEETPWVERLHAVLVDGMDLSDEEADKIIELGEARKNGKGKPGAEYTEEELEMLSTYNEAATDADVILDEEVESCIASEDGMYDSVLDQFRDDFYVDDDSGFFSDIGLRWMSDVANEYDLDWPYMNGASNGGSRDWEVIADSLNQAVDMPVKVSSGYHQATRKPGLWIVEPDSSLEPDDREDYGLEIVSPPMPLKQALEKLQAVTDWANSDEGNAYTNESTGLHMGVSIPYKEGRVDYLKLILFLGDEYVLQQYGREANTYTKAAMKEIRSRAGSEANATRVLELLKHNLIELAERELVRSTGEGKYTSAHKHDKYIEFRSAGGDWLAEDNAEPGKLENTMMRYAYAMYLAGNPGLERREYAKKLYKLVASAGDDSAIALFSRYAAGELNKEELKKQWAEKTLSKEAPDTIAKGNWVVVDNNTGRTVQGQEYSGYTEDEVRDRAKVALRVSDRDFDRNYSIHPKETGRWEVYRDDQGQEETLEIIDADRRGEAVDKAYEKYTGVIPFKVRAYYGDQPTGPAKELSPRAKLAKRIKDAPKEQPQMWQVVNRKTGEVYATERGTKSGLGAALRGFEKNEGIPQGDAVLRLAPDQSGAKLSDDEASDWEAVYTPTGRVIDTLAHADAEQAVTWRQSVIRNHGFDDASTIVVRRAGEQTPDVAQNFSAQTPPNATEQVGSWSIHDVTLNREVARMDNVSWQQATDRAEELERGTGHNMSVRGLRESVFEATGDQQFDRMMRGTTEPLTSIMSPRDPNIEMTAGELRYFEQLHGYVDRFMDKFVAKMDALGIGFTADRRPNPPPEPARPGPNATRAQWQQYHQAYEAHVADTEANWDFNPKFRQAYEQAALPAVRAFIKGLKLDPNNSELLDQVKRDFDHAADQYDSVAGFLGDFMRDFTMFRPGELDVLNRSGALRDPGSTK